MPQVIYRTPIPHGILDVFLADLCFFATWQRRPWATFCVIIFKQIGNDQDKPTSLTDRRMDRQFTTTQPRSVEHHKVNSQVQDGLKRPRRSSYVSTCSRSSSGGSIGWITPESRGAVASSLPARERRQTRQIHVHRLRDRSVERRLHRSEYHTSTTSTVD